MRAQSAPVLKHVGIVAIDGVFASTLMQAKDFFHMASLRHGKQQGLGLQPAFRTRILSPDGQPVRSFSGDSIAVDGPPRRLRHRGPARLLGRLRRARTALSANRSRLRRSHAEGTALCGEATGVFWLAQAGLLDGKEATTYWRFYREFAERFPNVLLNQEKHLTDADDLFCASGVTSACDLYIYLIERFCGGSVAQAVARDTLYEVQRSYTPGRIGFGGQKLHHDPTILQIQQWLEDHFADKFRFEDVARDHGMSIRNFMRRFQAATGDKPLHYLQRLRIETAKGMLSSTRKSIKTISYEVGYDDASFFARLFRQHTELSPHHYRRQFMQKES